MKAFLACWALWLVAMSPAQARSLYWPSLSVDLKVDAQGALHIVERHEMVFDGDWNGGERTFQLRSWHDLDFQSLTEIVPDSGARVALVAGDLDDVNEYDLNGAVLRWRARLPTDPPFQQTRKVYEIAYVLEGALLPEGEAFVLNHDLAFPDRDAEIQRFDATLEFAPEWQAADAPQSIHLEHLTPGQSAFVSARLNYVGPGRPAAVAPTPMMESATAMPALRHGGVAAVIAFALFSAVSWLRRERELGRFEPHVPVEQIDESWLRENVFSLRPELVGAAWDRKTSSAEVAALIARLTQEGKLASHVAQRGWGPFKREVLHLRMTAERSAFDSYERRLVDRLFFDGGTQTDTDAIRTRYRSKGFDPASEIDAPIRKRIPLVFGGRSRLPRWRPWLTFGLVVCAVVAMAYGGIRNPDTIPQAALFGLVLVFMYAAGLALAYNYSENVHDLPQRAARALVFPILACAGVTFALIGGQIPWVTAQLIGLPLLALAFLNSVFNRMHSREIAKGMQLRRALGSARKYFERELASEQPRLKDEWFPYVLAFGLGPNVDRWFRKFGDVTRSTRSYGGTSSSSGSGSASASTGSWTGGGGTFAGGGASGSWASAVAGVAAGVSAPSSSSGSGGGGGGGGGSSGGGGGGGW